MGEESRSRLTRLRGFLGGRGNPGVTHAYERALPFLRAFNVLNHAHSIAEWRSAVTGGASPVPVRLGGGLI